MPVLPRSGPPPLAPGRPATMASGGVGKSMNFVFSREPFACTLVHIPGEIPYRAPKKEKGKKNSLKSVEHNLCFHVGQEKIICICLK